MLQPLIAVILIEEPAVSTADGWFKSRGSSLFLGMFFV